MAGAVSSEAEYSLVAPVIRRVRLCNVEIDWDSPESRITAAFPFLSSVAVRRGSVERDLRALVGALCASDTLATFRRNEALLPLEHGSSWFAEYDSHFGELFISTARPFRDDLLASFRGPEKRAGLTQLGLPPSASFEDSLRWFQRHPLNGYALLVAFATSIAAHLGYPEDHPHVEALLNSYNGTIDLYVRARTRREFALMECRESPGRNDLLDLSHLLYVPSRAGLMTNDRDLIDIAVLLGVAVSQPLRFRAGA